MAQGEFLPETRQVLRELQEAADNLLRPANIGDSYAIRQLKLRLASKKALEILGPEVKHITNPEDETYFVLGIEPSKRKG